MCKVIASQKAILKLEEGCSCGCSPGIKNLRLRFEGETSGNEILKGGDGNASQVDKPCELDRKHQDLIDRIQGCAMTECGW